jgi:hypothetical protein
VRLSPRRAVAPRLTLSPAASQSKCSKPVVIPQSVKGVGPYATCPPPFGKAKKLVAVGATRESINCVYNPSSAGVSCSYSSKTGKKSKNSKGALWALTLVRGL